MAPAIMKKQRRRKRRGKKGSKQADVPFYAALPSSALKSAEEKAEEDAMEVEYVVEKNVEGLDKPEYEEFSKIFDYFVGDDDDEMKEGGDEEETVDQKAEEEEEEEEVVEKSKTQLRKERRPKIEVLKLLVDNPGVVELHDANAADPWLLVYLKGYRNTVAVPRHWLQRRKYLANKRGADKIPYELPDFIANTGISTIRQAVLDKEEAATSKASQRERTQGKMGKIDIDYQILYDAFFRFQTKPKLTGHGELYYEGKEFEVDVQERRPGVLSPALRKALGMPEKGHYPPPWLVNMQRCGPPPAYPGLRIPGVNAPVPPGAVLGMHVGGWGRPPTDEQGRPLYSTAVEDSKFVDQRLVVQPSKEHWGELQVMEEEEEQPQYVPEQEEEEYDALAVDDEDMAGGTVSVATTVGFETPANLDLRKQRPAAPAAPQAPGRQQLYQELVQEKTSVGNQVFGSNFRYVTPGAERVDLIRSQKGEQVNITLDPSDLEAAESGLTEDIIKKKYEEQRAAEKAASKREDFSDMVAADSARRKQREKKKDKKKDKFKF